MLDDMYWEKSRVFIKTLDYGLWLMIVPFRKALLRHYLGVWEHS